MLDRKPRYSLLDPYFKDESLDGYRYMFEYVKKSHKKLHDFLFKNVNGIIASDMDYYLPLEGHPKFIGLVANPVNLSRLAYTKISIEGPIVVFLGINRSAYHKKGIPFFEEALHIIKDKYGSRVEIIIAESLPYDEYINLYNKAHIVLDQIYAYDQGYNAIEAMAKGKVVFTGAEKEFMEYYNLTERVAVNALPDTQQIVDELSYLIDNPHEIEPFGKRARDFVEREHEYVKVAGKYLEKWTGLS
jgi:glycosyltransferase involved in cell wall biosynthesis